MAVSIDHLTFVITVPKHDLLLIQSSPVEIRQLDLNALRLVLKDIEDDNEGMTLPTTHTHNAPVAVGGVTLARVVEVIAPYSITFEDGKYAVNLVGANSNVADVVNVNQVSVRSANSAGLTFSEVINDQSFTDSSVHIDVENGLSGVGFPRGTPTDPVNNIQDAYVIASQRKLRSYYIRGEVTLDIDYTNWTFKGAGVEIEDIVNVAGCDISGSSFVEIDVTGTMALPTTPIDILNGRVRLLYNFWGNLENCAVSNDVFFASGQSNLFNCYSDAPGTQNSILDCQHNFVNIFIRGFIGVYQLSNLSLADSFISVDMISGKVTLNPSIDLSAGASVSLRGVSLLSNNSVTPELVSNSLVELTNDRAVASAVWEYQR